MKLNIKSVFGLSPRNFTKIKEPVLFIVDKDKQTGECVRFEEKKTEDERVYKSYSLLLTGSEGEWVGDFEINYLFESDIRALVAAWGDETAEWVGKGVLLKGKKEENGFAKWIITPSEVKV